MVVQKTLRRHGLTLEHGPFEVRETVLACKAGCRHPSGMAVTHRPQTLAQLIPRGAVVGYDVIVHVGLQRFLHHRQREEIRATLKSEHGINLSTGEISTLNVRFLGYLQELHESRSDAIREALATDGGWPLHVDATGEDGRGTLFMALAGWRRWVLGSWKIPTECAEAIVPRLRSTIERFGAPCAVMRDLGRAMIPAVTDVVTGFDLAIPVLACHQHFLADIGSDLLKGDHGKLRGSFRRFKTRPGLRALARDLGRKLSDSIVEARQAVQDWQNDAQGDHVLPEGCDGLAVIRALAQWVLDYAADSTYQSFPYDRPYLDFYDRCSRARRAIDAFRRHLPDDRALRRNLNRFCRLLDPILSDTSTAQIAATIRARASLFDELRDTLRLVPRASHDEHTSSSHSPCPEETREELNDIRTNLDRWVADLRQRRPERGPAKDTREAIDLILDHIDRHGSSLWGHVISLPKKAGGGIRLVDRTNNIQENFFHEMKHGERRRSGRKILTQDFEHLPPAAALAYNLNCPDYVAVVCGELEQLPTAFAELDAKRREAKRLGLSEARSAQEAAPTDPVSASLPTADRRLVRSEAMGERVNTAARSRAPRTSNPTSKRAG
jgi:hypothetical protein